MRESSFNIQLSHFLRWGKIEKKSFPLASILVCTALFTWIGGLPLWTSQAGSGGPSAVSTCRVGPASGSDQTRQIQETINQCPSGGTILLAPGETYTSGSLYLKSNTLLKFGDENTVLRASPDFEKIDVIPQTSHHGFVIGYKVENVAIEGPGRIVKVAENGHSMVEFQRSSGVRVSKITIDSRGVHYHGFHLVTQGSDHVTFEQVTIYGQQVSSGWPWGGNDGIDIQNSQHVRVRDCFVETHDDGIAIASPKSEVVEDVLIENCTVSSDSAAIKFGTGSHADMRNITLRDMHLRKSRNAGIRIVLLDGGTIENVTFSNFSIASDVNAWILCGRGGSKGTGGCVAKRDENSELGTIQDINFTGFNIQGGGGSRSRINEMDRVTFRNFNFNGSSSTIEFSDICGLSISGLTGDENMNIDIQSDVQDVVFDGSPPKCAGSGPSPTPTPAPTPTPTPTFLDVPATHWAYDYIETLFQQDYIVGCSSEPPMFCPEQVMNRAESAVFVERGIHGGGYTPSDPSGEPFLDVSSDEWYAKWVVALWEDGYTAGCDTEPISYCPAREHTRAEGTVFFLRMMQGPSFEPPPPEGLFTDVPTDYWGAKWIEAAYAAGLIPACETDPGLKFCPHDPLTRAMGAYMMVQAKGLPPNE